MLLWGDWSSTIHCMCNYISFLLLFKQTNTNLVALNKTNVLCCSSEGRKPKIEVRIPLSPQQAKIKVLAGLPSFWSSGKESISLPFQLLKATCIPGLAVPSSISKASRSQWVSLTSHHSDTASILTSPLLLPLSTAFKTALWLHWIPPDNPG